MTRNRCCAPRSLVKICFFDGCYIVLMQKEDNYHKNVRKRGKILLSNAGITHCENFNQHLECAAPKCWSKYTTVVVSGAGGYLAISCQVALVALLPVWILAVKGAPGTSSLLKVMLMMWSVPSRGTKLTMNLAEPWGCTWVGMLRPLALMVISRLPSP